MLRPAAILAALLWPVAAWAEGVEVVEKGVPMLLDKGLLGLAVLALSGVVVYLYMDGRALRKEITGLAKETATGLANSSATVATLVTEVAEASRVNQQVLSAVSTVVTHSEGLSRQIDSNGGRMDRLIDLVARSAK